MKELKKIAEAYESTKRKWTKTLFYYKQHHEVLSSQVEALTKKKKEKDNVLIDIKLIHLKSASLFNFEELRRKTS